MPTEGWTKHKLREKPLYPFRVPTGLDDDDRRLLSEIYFDVTLIFGLVLLCKAYTR